MIPLSDLRGFLVDLDGVVYRGNAAVPGAQEFFDFLRRRNLKFCLITNNSTRTPAQFAEKLRGMDIDVGSDAVFTAGQATALYMKEVAPNHPPLYVIGEEGLTGPLLQAGFRLDNDAPRYLVMGLDRKFSYEKLERACLVLQAGATFVASNPDPSMPNEDGTFLPGAGALLAAVTACTGIEPIVIGKPQAKMLYLAMERLGTAPHETAIIGDRLDTDILAGVRAGITTILVLTGATRREDLFSSQARPDYVFDDLVELRAALERRGQKAVPATRTE